MGRLDDEPDGRAYVERIAQVCGGPLHVRRARELQRYACEVAVQVVDPIHLSRSGWHDRIADTEVVYVSRQRPVPNQRPAAKPAEVAAAPAR